MKFIVLACVCAAVALAGCKSKAAPPPQTPTKPAATVPVVPPTTMPAQSRHAADTPRVTARSPQQRLQEAVQKYPQELLTLRRFHWGRTPTPAVMAAASKVLQSQILDFSGMNQTQVKSLLGNPRAKQTLRPDVLWTYSYTSGSMTVTCSLRFHNGTVSSDPQLIAGL
jgi:hypothetical protein